MRKIDKQIINFSVDKIELLEDIKQNRFQKAKIYAFADGKNSHTLDIDNDVLTKCADTIYDIPIVYKYNKYVGDFEGHEPDEVPCGFIKEESNNPVVFSKVSDGRTFITIIGTIWKKYSADVLRVFNQDGNKKSVSVEMAITDSETINDELLVKGFVLEGITILGDFINPAVKGANIQLEFSEDKQEYLNELKFDSNYLEIDNRKESAIDGLWVDPRRKLFTPTLKASNKEILFSEEYLVDGDIDNPMISDYKFAHHVINNGKLVLHIGGLKAAFAKIKKNNINDVKIKEHLLRHFNELGLDTECFSEINNESVGVDKLTKEEKEFAEKEKADKEKADKEAADKAKADKEEEMSKETKDTDKDGKEAEKEEEKKEDQKEEKTESKAEEDKEEKKEDMSDDAEAMKNMSVEMSKLKDENAAYMAKIEAMSDYEDLKKFKADTEEKNQKDAEMSTINKVMSEIENRGITMSETEKTEMQSKIKEFSSIDAWSNYVKAQVFDRVENIDGIVKIGLPFENSKKTGSIWDTL